MNNKKTVGQTTGEDYTTKEITQEVQKEASDLISQVVGK